MVRIKSSPRSDKPKATHPKKSSFRSRKTGRGGTSIVHVCGHKQRHPIPGPKWKKEREIKRLEGLECTHCWARQKAEESELLCDHPDLPPLKGTPGQVAWARSLRGICISKIKADAWRIDRLRQQKELPPVTEQYLALVLPPLLKKLEARWWIDSREGDPLELALNSMEQDAMEAIRQETLQAPEVARPVGGIPVSGCPF